MRSHLIGYDARSKPICLNEEERRTHMHVIGSSGSGKSKFLEQLMRNHLKYGEPFCLVDPHGSLYESVLNYAAHYVLKGDIILLNLSEPQNIIGFNPFHFIQDGDIGVHVDRLVDATIHAWNIPNTDSTPTLSRMLRLVFTVLIEHGLTISQAAHLIDFEDKDVRTALIERLESPLVRQEWEELLRLTRREWREEILSSKNRLFRLVNSKTLSRFMGIPGPGLDLQSIMDQGKSLLINIKRSDYLSHENARVFGALFISVLFEAAFRRKKTTPYYLYLDEFQNFVSLDIADMLDQVRKFGLFLTLAHQRFGQLDDNVLEAAISHCRIKAVFGGLDVPTARRMAEELFIGKLDPTRVKAAIYQTKFWPKYERDRVYTKGSSLGVSSAHASSAGRGTSDSFAYGSSWGSATGSFYQAGDFLGPGVSGESSANSFAESEVRNSGSNEYTAESDSNGWSETESESEADIPIFVPVPFRELSSVQYYSLEEQLTEMTAALKRQFPRHCFIEIHQRSTQPMLVPYVTENYTPPSNARSYLQEMLSAQHALPAAEADRLIKEADEELRLKLAGPVIDMVKKKSESAEEYYE